jgi:lipid-binding SYLF domain-containing protein
MAPGAASLIPDIPRATNSLESNEIERVEGQRFSLISCTFLSAENRSEFEPAQSRVKTRKISPTFLNKDRMFDLFSARRLVYGWDCEYGMRSQRKDDIKMRRLFLLLLPILVAAPLFAQKDSDERLKAAAGVMHDIMQAADKGIPQDLLEKAECVIVVPNLKKGGFIVGGKYGRGFFSCRKRSGVGWAAPAGVKVEGGSFGLLIGGAETDVIMLVMNRKGADSLLSSKFTLGGDISAAAGPVGRDSTAQTDAKMRAEILTYSRQRGVFGGISLDGSTLRPDDEANKELYGREISNKDIVMGSVPIPPAATGFISELNKYSSRK